MTFMPFTFDSPAGLYAPAMYLYEHGLTQWIYPPELVAEPPLAHIGLALVWKLFGVSLWSSHLFISIFTLGAVYQIARFVQRNVSSQAFPWMLALVFSEATWVAQSLQLAPDMVLVFFAFWAINASIQKQRILFAVLLALLCMVSIRGSVTAGGIWAASLLLAFRESKDRKRSFKQFTPILFAIVPAALLVLAWFMERKIATGFFYFNPAFAFIAHRQVVTPLLFLRNIAVIGFRMVDNGRIAFWIALASLLFLGRQQFWTQLKRLETPVVYGATIFFAFLPVTLPFTNPFNQRYFLVSFLMLALVVAHLCWNLLSPMKAKGAILSVIVVLWCSHLVVYPMPISIAWDSTLAVVPYFTQKADVEAYFKSRNIPLNEVGFDIGECTPYSDRYAPNDPSVFHDHDFAKNRYVVLSRIQNPKNGTLDTLKQAWQPVADLSRQRLVMKIYSVQRSMEK